LTDPEVLDDAGDVVGEPGVFGIVEVVEAVPPESCLLGLATESPSSGWVAEEEVVGAVLGAVGGWSLEVGEDAAAEVVAVSAEVHPVGGSAGGRG
jgi:hypothetical protein